MSDARELSGRPSATLDGLARAASDPSGIVNDPKELAVDIWESDEEVYDFLADLQASRNAFPA